VYWELAAFAASQRWSCKTVLSAPIARNLEDSRGLLSAGWDRPLSTAELMAAARVNPANSQPAYRGNWDR